MEGGMEKGKSVVIQLPDEDMLQRADLNSDQLESLVKSMLGSQVGRGIDDVIIRGGRLSGGKDAASTWTKTIWKRAC
jgi:hypothetical protein